MFSIVTLPPESLNLSRLAFKDHLQAWDLTEIFINEGVAIVVELNISLTILNSL